MAFLDAGLRRALVNIARTPRLMVACDYDGTLAPIGADPRSVHPLPEAVAALRTLACLPETTAAVISGRALRDLAVLSRLPSEVHLVGSHGSEFDVGFVHALQGQAQFLHARLRNTLRRLAGGADGVILEVKPASVAVHMRHAEPAVAQRVLAKLRSGPCTWPGVHVTEGDAVVELSVVRTDKGEALEVVRHRCGATAVVFVGDDVSAEEVFVALSGPDLGIKVGVGDTLAPFRIPGSTEVAAVLSLLSEERSAWLYGEPAAPIERLSMLGNGRSVALVTPDARVCWQCVPGPASAAVFADLLGGRSAGHFSVRPHRDCLPLGQRYAPGTMTLETRWPGLLVTDYLDQHTPPGRTDLIRVISGSARAVVEFAPRPEFGQVAVQLHPVSDGLVVAGISDPMVLRSQGVAWDVIPDGQHESRPRGSRARPGPAGDPGIAVRHGRPVPPSAARGRGGARSPALTGRMAGEPVPAHAWSPAWWPVPRSRCGHCATAAPAASWPPRPPRCRRRSAESATGTTATAGCETRP